MQFLQPLFAAFAIIASFLLSPTPGGLAALDPPVIRRTTLSQAAIEYGPVTGTLAISALQVSTAEDLALYTFHVGSFVWGSTLPTVHAWGRDALQFVDGHVSSVTSSSITTMGSIIRASIDAHDAMYRGGRAWHIGGSATSACTFANARSRLPRPAILGLPAPPRRLALPPSPRSSVLGLPAPARHPLLTLPAPRVVLSLPPTPPPLPWLVPAAASNTFPSTVSLTYCTSMLTWEAPKDRPRRFLRRARILGSRVDDSITEQQMLAVVLLVVLWTLLGDLIVFGLDSGYILCLLNGVGIDSTQNLLEDDDTESPVDSSDELLAAEPALVEAPACVVEASVDVVEEQATHDALSNQATEPAERTVLDRTEQLALDSPTVQGHAEPASPLALAFDVLTEVEPTVALTEVEPAADTCPPEPVAPAQDSAEYMREPDQPIMQEGPSAELPAEVSWGPDLLAMVEAAKQRRAELEAVLVPSNSTSKAPKVPCAAEPPVQHVVPAVAAEPKPAKTVKRVRPQVTKFRWADVYMRLEWAKETIQWEDVPSAPAPASEPTPIVPAPTPTSTPTPVSAPAPTSTLTPVEPALSRAPSPKPELESAVAPEVDTSPAALEPVRTRSPSPLPQAGPSELAATPAASLDEPTVEQPSEVEGGEVEPKKKRTRGVCGGKWKRQYLQRLAENGGTEVRNGAEVGNDAEVRNGAGVGNGAEAGNGAEVRDGETEVVAGIEREPSDSRWFIRHRRQARS
ncbi:hypothetical protein RhiJN_21977 [Ceratobasidium sp. AG-Ba]|nr:hypothetical protein RhiJN_21977 [Ceratobasidium sp. AG-Ba]